MSYDSIINNFNNHIILNESIKNVVIYGTGELAKCIISNIKSDKICGLMDQNRTGEYVYGQKVLSYEEVASIKDVVIVIAARASVINIIVRRIEKFCKVFSIDIYDANGNKVNTKREYIDNRHKCFSLKKDELMNMCKEAELISFDIFDTLICRKVLRPRDIFTYIDGELENKTYIFSQERINAEEKLNEYGTPTIEQIYNQMQENTSISDDEKRRLTNLEIEVEKKFIIPRKEMIQVYKTFLKMNKRVILVSDMYFTKEIIEMFLEENGINGYEDLIISCEYGCKKEQGLFNVVLEKTGIEASKIIHIGDNEIADINAPSKIGIKGYRVYSTSEMIEYSIYSHILQEKMTFEENVVVGTFAANIYNSPFSGYDEGGIIIVNNDLELIRYFVAPIIFKYIIWMITIINQNNNDYVIFPSRDGYVLQQIYEVMREDNLLPPSMYLYASRQAVLIAAARERQDIEYILKFPDDRSFRDMVKARFGEEVEANSLEELTEMDYSLLLNRSKEEREKYNIYLQNTELLKVKNGAFIDFVAMGTVQEAMERLLRKHFNGVYFVKRISDGYGTKNINVSSLYESEDDYASTSKVYQLYYLLENILSSYEASLEKFDENGVPVLYPEKRSNTQIDILKACHKEIIDYCKEMKNCCNNANLWTANVKIYDCILGFMSNDSCIINDSVLFKMNNIDEFMGKIQTEINI